MDVQNQKVSVIILNSLLGLSELLWLFSFNNIFSEVIFFLVVCSFFFIFSSLSTLHLSKFDRKFILKNTFALVLELVVMILLVL